MAGDTLVTVNSEGTLLASAPRTATATSATMKNFTARGVFVGVVVSAATTGGLTVRIRGVDPISGDNYTLGSYTQITATGRYGFILYPGAVTAALAGTGTVQTIGTAFLPRQWYVDVTAGDASSWTYSVSYVLCA